MTTPVKKMSFDEIAKIRASVGRKGWLAMQKAVLAIADAPPKAIALHDGAIIVQR